MRSDCYGGLCVQEEREESSVEDAVPAPVPVPVRSQDSSITSSGIGLSDKEARMLGESRRSGSLLQAQRPAGFRCFHGAVVHVPF